MRIVLNLGHVLWIVTIVSLVVTGHLQAGCSSRKGEIACGVALRSNG